ncbi:hypothetical protein BDW60DRAFT_211417 [Aspergillus nidulans var. acristatus]
MAEGGMGPDASGVSGWRVKPTVIKVKRFGPWSLKALGASMRLLVEAGRFELGPSGLALQGRVTAYYLDEDSDSNILVYDDNQWVAHMSPEARESRVSRYKSLNMGGSWATGQITKRQSTQNPLESNNLHDGNWSSLTCDNNYYKGTPYYTPSERWAARDVDQAWDDMVKAWKYYRDNVNQTSFTGYMAYMMDWEGYGKCWEIVEGCGGNID